MYRVSVVMLTRDDSRRIERALLSVKPFVDDLFVLDLGSLDDTERRARDCGAVVERATWSADAAALRNEALRRCGADWHVVLEAGEWVDAGGDGLSALRDIEPTRAGTVEVIPADASRGLSPTALAPRILPGAVRHAGRHRDAPDLQDLASWRTDVVLAHDDGDAARWRHDRQAAEAVILQALALHPDEPRLLTELGDVLRSQDRLGEACDVYLAALGDLGEGVDRPHGLVVDALDTLRQARRFREAIALMDAEMPRRQDSPDFSFVVGDLFFEMLLDQPGTAVQLAPLAVTSWKRAIDIGDRPGLPGAVTGRGSFLAAQNLATLYLALGVQEEADHWWSEADRLRAQASSAAARLPG